MRPLVFGFTTVRFWSEETVNGNLTSGVWKPFVDVNALTLNTGSLSMGTRYAQYNCDFWLAANAEFLANPSVFSLGINMFAAIETFGMLPHGSSSQTLQLWEYAKEMNEEALHIDIEPQNDQFRSSF